MVGVAYLALFILAVASACVQQSRAPSDHVHTITLGLRNRNLDTIYEAARSVNDPRSTLYGKFWTWKEVVSATANTAGLKATTEYLLSQNANIVSVTPDKL